MGKNKAPIRTAKEKETKKIASRTLDVGGAHAKIIEREDRERKERPITRATEIAGSTFFKVNFYHPELKKKFPGNQKLWHVDKFYPYAQESDFASKGNLFVDEPRFDFEILNSRRKAEVLEKVGVKLLILKNGTELLEESV